MGGKGSKPSGQGKKPAENPESDATRQDPSCKAGDDFDGTSQREEDDKETNDSMNGKMEVIPSMAHLTFPPVARLGDSAAILDTAAALTLYCNVCIGESALHDQPSNAFKNLECASCNCKFTSSSVKETSAEEDNNDAKTSDRDFGKASAIDHELLPHASDTSSSVLKENSKAEDIHVSKTFPCVVCNRRFGNAFALGDHQLSHASDKSASDLEAASTAQNSKVTEMFPCTVCSRSFGSASALGDHQRSHASADAEARNVICGRKFAGMSALKEHQRAKHPTQSVKNFDCSVCDRTFGSKSALKAHQTAKNHGQVKTAKKRRPDSRGELMDVDAFKKIIRKQLTMGFSKEHETLLKICFGVIKPDPSEVKPLSLPNLGESDLRNMIHMNLVEFAASLEKELSNDSGQQEKTDPRPYDVFLVEKAAGGKPECIAACLPRTKSDVLWWYDGGKELIPLSDLIPKRRIASMSGPSRVLESLSKAPLTLTQSSMKREMLVDGVGDSSSLQQFQEDSDLIDRIQKLNQSQQLALATLTGQHFTHGFQPVIGPPGCGKTTFLVAAIAAIGKGILVVAPSNAAVANIAVKVFKTGRFALHEISVFGSNTDPAASFLNPKARGDKYALLERRIKAARGNSNKQDKLRREFRRWLHLPEEQDGESSTAQENLAPMCRYYNMETPGGRKALQAQLRKSKVIFTTLNCAGSQLLIKSEARVRTLMLDEGGQTPESDFFIATNFPGIRKIVIVGDPMQLPATVVDPVCQRHGLGTSWLSKIHKLKPEKVMLLDTQYRMHPQILTFPNLAFYESRILCGENVQSRDTSVEHPFLLVDTTRRRGKEVQDSALSWKNPQEATVIQKLLECDSDVRRLVQDPARPTRIIVISPYNAQVALLRSMLVCPPGCTLDVATVDSFQGQEGDIVIVSTVRTGKIGFVDDPQRLNVAMTRSKQILRVVGDVAFFKRLQKKDSTLKALCHYAESIGGIVEAL